MNRRIFLKRAALISTGVIIAPTVIITSKSNLDRYTVAKPLMGGIWIKTEELHAIKDFMNVRDHMFLYRIGIDPCNNNKESKTVVWKSYKKTGLLKYINTITYE